MGGRRFLVPRDVAADRNDANEDVVATYVAELGARLHGPTRARTDVLDEIRAGLDDSVEKFTARGLGEADAARSAVSELGPAAAVADAFAGELAIARARRMLRLLLITGPVVGIWWFLLLAPDQWQSRPGLLIAAIPALPMVAAAVATGILVLATTGSLMRWVPETTASRAVILTALVGLTCIIGDVTVLTALALRTTTGSTESMPVGLAAAAVIASVIRLPFAVWATGSSMRTAHRLHLAHIRVP
jgi:hypothetical protein